MKLTKKHVGMGVELQGADGLLVWGTITEVGPGGRFTYGPLPECIGAYLVPPFKIVRVWHPEVQGRE